MCTARQSSERPPRSESPCRISRTGYATRRLRLRGQQCGIRFHGHSKGTSLVGVRSTFDIRGFPARSTKSRGFPAVATVKTSSPQIHQWLRALKYVRHRGALWRLHPRAAMTHYAPRRGGTWLRQHPSVRWTGITEESSLMSSIASRKRPR